MHDLPEVVIFVGAHGVRPRSGLVFVGAGLVPALNRQTIRSLWILWTKWTMWTIIQRFLGAVTAKNFTWQSLCPLAKNSPLAKREKQRIAYISS